MRDFADQPNRFADATLAEVTTGLVAGTQVATGLGWRVIEAIAPGDKVLTFDGGLQEVVSVERQIVWAGGDVVDPSLWPLHVPAGALGNREEMSILPRQAVLVESDTAEAVFGDPFAMIPAAALDGFRGITPAAPAPRLEIVTLRFAQDEIVFGNVGALFHCPAAHDLCQAPAPAPYSCLSLAQADLLVACLEDEDRGRAPALQVAAALQLAA